MCHSACFISGIIVSSRFWLDRCDRSANAFFSWESRIQPPRGSNWGSPPLGTIRASCLGNCWLPIYCHVYCCCYQFCLSVMLMSDWSARVMLRQDERHGPLPWRLKVWSDSKSAHHFTHTIPSVHIYYVYIHIYIYTFNRAQDN